VLTPVVDARDPVDPLVVARLGEYSHSVFVRVDARGRPLAYLATYGPDLPIYDLSVPSAPVLLERVPLPNGVGVHDLYAEEDRLYLNGTDHGFNGTDHGFFIMDRAGDGWVASRALPTPYSHASWVGEVAGRRLAVTGDEGIDAYLHVVDVDPASSGFMTEVGTYQTRREVSIHNMMMFGAAS